MTAVSARAGRVVLYWMPMFSVDPEPEAVRTTLSASWFRRLRALTDPELGITMAHVLRQCVAIAVPILEERAKAAAAAGGPRSR